MNDQSEIKERVKAAVNLADYIIASGVPLKGGPVEFKACCPFHVEKTGSFTVNEDKRLFHCFGCGASGDVFDYVMLTRGLDFTGALKLVANSVGISLPERRIYQPPEAKVSVREGVGRGAFHPENFRPLVPGTSPITDSGIKLRNDWLKPAICVGSSRTLESKNTPPSDCA